MCVEGAMPHLAAGFGRLSARLGRPAPGSDVKWSALSLLTNVVKSSVKGVLAGLKHPIKI